MKPTRFTQEMIDEYVRKGYWDTSVISDFWDRNAIPYTHEEAIVEENAKLTWYQAKQQIDRIALSLLELGIKKNEKIAVQLYNCAELFILPIGNHYTMDPKEAAYAAKLLGSKYVIPIHYGTSPVLTGTAEEFSGLMKEVPKTKVLVLTPGETVQ